MKNKLVLTVGFLMLGTSCLNAATLKLTDATGIIGVIGESEGESQIGRIAVAEVIRRRGSLKGIYGANAVFVKDGHYYRKTKKGIRKISDQIVLLSKAAWFDSRYTNYSKGATNWEAIETFGRPDWAKEMVITAKIGNHTFMRRR